MALDAALGRLGIKAGVCTSSTRPTNPFEGQVIYETDTNRTLVYDNAAWLVVADNQVLSIDTTNSRVGINDTSPSYALDVTGDINASGALRIGGTAIGEWTAFTPSWNNVTVGNATQSFFYCVLNKTVVIRGQFVFGSTTSFSGTVSMNVPYGTQVADPGIEIGGSTYNDIDTGFLYMGHNDGSAQTIRFWVRLANTTLVVRGGTQLSGTYPFTWATGDFLRVGAMYRIS